MYAETLTVIQAVHQNCLIKSLHHMYEVASCVS